MTEETQQIPPANPVGADATPLEVECIVRPDVSPVSQRRIDAIRSRLENLRETTFVEDITVSEWPPYQPAPVEEATDRAYRQARVTEFEQWADENDCSLKPAFRRQPVPGSLLDDDEESREAIRVPVVTLALSTVDDGSLSGVVPYTIDYGTDDAETYTVDDWLSAAEAAAIPEGAREPALEASPNSV